MKTVPIGQATLDSCVADAQRERVLVTRDGAPIALIVGLEGMDEEQVALGLDGAFWAQISVRRREATIDRAELERRLGGVE